MFVVLRVITPEESLFKRRKQRKTIERAGIKSCHSEKSLPFFVLDVLKEKRGINWDSVAEKCGKYASRIVAPRNFPLPDHSNLRRFIPISMNSLLIFNTAAETIKKAKLEPENTCITLSDRNAVHYSKVCSLLPFASCVKVITSRPERYVKACSEAYENYGATLLIRKNFEPSTKNDVVICCDGAISSSMKDAAIFTSSRKSGGKIRLCGSGIELSDEHRELIGDSISSVDFAGALTELCGSSVYRNSLFEKIEISCKKCDESAPENCLQCCFSESFPL